MVNLTHVPATDFDPVGFEDDLCGYHWLTDVERLLKDQDGLSKVVFPHMDKTGRGACEKFNRGECDLGPQCPLRHINMNKSVVCKHWLRGLCKKGDQCEFLHEIDLEKMPECFFYSKFKACSNKECPFRHIDPDSKIKDCPWYDRGFCRHGPFCKHRHRRRVMCPFFLAGFCSQGKECKDAHPSFAIPSTDPKPKLFQPNYNPQSITCHNCQGKGHKATYCPLLINSQGNSIKGNNVNMNTSISSTTTNNSNTPSGPQLGRTFQSHNHNFDKRSLSEVTCFKCGEKGHYANRCGKGSLAFLSHSRNNEGA
ncbi:Putative cleavage and polyadenylation specificity factor subunit 4-like protein [Strongyloides ratti]|uniref:Cleavage and polyadenylation specificity factor subunit 4 n=1 Tax=Strongyloides ratti TaxID=34506 RepID=A0A090L046_STRRB|nr:Putative cleavage and polyadenylation specificity factor subunit 4-like protein [Strongyloides ratti]CEF63051.1 Putative cleavage and polyadenylation specificity factor subunit 4-like protein [Strongyloides ratti]